MTKIVQVPQTKLTHDEFVDALNKVPDEVLQRISFSHSWQYSGSEVEGREGDADGFVEAAKKEDQGSIDRDTLQRECFAKFHSNPHVNTSVRGMVGRLTGLGFGTSCGEVFKIQEAIEEIELDPRNRLYNFWPKWIGRFNIEGELFLCFTVHKDGFIEIDFIDPGMIAHGGDGNSGIIYHPSKPTMPLFYNIKKTGAEARKMGGGSVKDKLSEQIPSVFIARYPDLVTLAAKHDDFFRSLQRKSKNPAKMFKKTGGYYRFIVSWDRGFMTRRAVSYLRTVLEWLNHYETLKKYEIDHKKASGSYVWVFSFEDLRAFRTWLSLSDDEKRKTAVGSKLTPGGRLVLPPGMTVSAESPDLPQIKDQDTDILQLVASGLNEPQDILTGTSRGTFSSVKASRGPFSDRVSDEIAFFDRFLKHDFWGSIFFLKSCVSEFDTHFKVRRAVRFENKKPIFKSISRRPELLIQIAYPVSDVIDMEARAKGLLGVKHGPMSEQLGVSNTWVAERVGVGNYDKARLEKATEDELYPELVYEAGVDAESTQEKVEGEKKKAKNAQKQMEDMNDALSKLSSEFATAVSGILTDSENRSQRDSDHQSAVLSNLLTNISDLKSNLEDKPINISLPESNVTLVNKESEKKERNFKIIRGEDGLAQCIENSHFEVVRATDGSVTAVEKGGAVMNIVRDEDGLVTTIEERKNDGNKSDPPENSS